MEFHNTSGLTAEVFTGKDLSDEEIDLLLIKGTYSITDTGEVALADEQEPFAFADIFSGAPGESSLIYTCDVCFNKIATDIAMNGSIRMDENEEGQIVSLKVGLVEKHLALFHQREWSGAAGIYRQKISGIVDEIPLCYEYSFGGSDLTHDKEKHHDIELRNPVGIGFISSKTGKKISGESLPFIEDLTELIKRPKDTPAPAGFGFIAPSWSPRSELAGSFIENWEKLPPDLDIRFFNAAHPDLIYPGFMMEGEVIEIEGVWSTKRFIQTPSFPKAVAETFDEEGEVETSTPFELVLDKLVIDTDTETVTMLWRCPTPPESITEQSVIRIEG